MPGFNTYDAIGNAEDVQDDIYMISPRDNPVASMSRTIQATGRLHEWQEDELAAPKKNAAVEGADAGDDTSTPTVMKTAYTQIFEDVAQITRTQERVKKYGRASEMSYQVMKRYAELANDEESAIAGGAGGTGQQTGSAGDATTNGRELPSIYAQVDAGNIVDATLAADTGALETMLLQAIQAQYGAGGNASYLITDDATVAYFPDFALSAGRTRDITDTTLVNAVDIYVSQWGTFDVVIDRNMANAAGENAILVFDPDYSATPVLDPTQDYELAKVGDSERRQVIRESTYAVLNSKAHAIVEKVQTGLAPA